MESLTLKSSFLRISHLPSICLAIGYFIYWPELWFLKNKPGSTSMLASSLFACIAFFTIIKRRNNIYSFCNWIKVNWYRQALFSRSYILIGVIFVIFISAIVFYASLLPVHLSQEFDALNYHLTIPRQHLILKTFTHIKWSHADLFLTPLDFALSPYWFVTSLPNKFPQFLFLIGLILVSVNLVRRFSQNNFASICLIVFAIFGAHFIGIQMGTAMLDIAAAYLFILTF